MSMFGLIIVYFRIRSHQLDDEPMHEDAGQTGQRSLPEARAVPGSVQEAHGRGHHGNGGVGQPVVNGRPNRPDSVLYGVQEEPILLLLTEKPSRRPHVSPPRDKSYCHKFVNVL